MGLAYLSDGITLFPNIENGKAILLESPRKTGSVQNRLTGFGLLAAGQVMEFRQAASDPKETFEISDQNDKITAPLWER